MKFVLLLVLTVFSGCLFGRDIEQDECMWIQAYRGDFSLAHKLVLSREVEDINDELMTQFVMAYVHYKMGNCGGIEPILKGIDFYIERTLIAREK